MLRVSGDAKQRIESAAKLKGLSMTSFVLDAATKAAARVGTPSGERPTFFRALCSEARQGGANSYFTAGHELARHYPRLADEDDAESLEKLLDERSDRELIRDGDFSEADDAILDFLSQTLPRCMALVPARRYQSFLDGFYAFVDEYGLEH